MDKSARGEKEEKPEEQGMKKEFWLIIGIIYVVIITVYLIVMI